MTSQTQEPQEEGELKDARLLDVKAKKIKKKADPPIISPIKPKKGPTSTSTKQSMAYITVKGIENQTSYLQRDWPIFAMKELMDNGYDSLNDYYPNSSEEARKIVVCVNLDPIPNINDKLMFRMAVRNSNVDNIEVFEDLEGILDFNQWVSTKRNQHRETCGSLGDFLKRSLGMGYASWTSNDNPELSFEDKQWLEPLILRFDDKQIKAFIVVDIDNQTYYADIKPPTKFDAPDFSEVEIALPIDCGHTVTSYNYNTRQNDTIAEEQMLLNKLEKYYKKYKIMKIQTDFSLRIEGLNKYK